MLPSPWQGEGLGTKVNKIEVMMTTITISLPADHLQKLREVAAQYRIAPEDLVRASVEELLAQPEEEFKRALEYVLDKNAELYRRLA